eukprot:TRINITY_DN12394_c0_g1_i3.p1 TRINITY_DN12394_c0_g1~~TRINITY_DN12394_c0_g1_i3.p1  ORF type:complete len:118 (+),score=19.25 TRINITY_DN12394_c0_g1_i3:511-864(+)
MHSFELFGYDFMIDKDLKVSLIEANINPCLETTSLFSSRFVNTLINNTLRIAVDPLFPPPSDFAGRKASGEVLSEIKYELIFDQKIHGKEITELYKNKDISEVYEELNNQQDDVYAE